MILPFIRRFFSKIIVIGILLGTVSFAWADSSFVVQNIVIQGNDRLTAATITSYIPIHPGQHYTDATGDAAITTLFNTGFFDNVKLASHI